MPLYEYEEIASGRRIELCRSVESRDDVRPGLRRVTVPRRLGVLTGILPENDIDRAAPKAFRSLEDTLSAREIARQSGFSIDHIKRVWSLCLALAFLCVSAAAADITSGYTFVDNEQKITAAKLNAVVGGAVINPSFLTLKSAATTLGSSDLVLIYSQIGAGFRRTTLSALLYENTAFFTAPTEYYAPATNDYMVVYDTSATGNRKLQLGVLFTNAYTGLLPALTTLPELSSTSNNPSLLAWDGGSNNVYRSLTLTNLAGMLDPSSLGAASSTWTNGELFTVWDATNTAGKHVNISAISNLVALLTPACGQIQVEWTSTGQILLSNHNLGTVPSYVRTVIVCRTNANWAVVGQEIDASAVFVPGGNQVLTWGADATNVWVNAEAYQTGGADVAMTGPTPGGYTMDCRNYLVKVYFKR